MYNNQHRLTAVNCCNALILQMDYAINGNIASKSDVGSYTYGTSNSKPHAVKSISNQPAPFPSSLLNTMYNAWGKIDTISLNKYNGTALSMDIVYGPHQERWYSVFTSDNDTIRETVYAGNYEKVTENGITREFYYLDGNVIVVKQDGVFTPYLAFKDNLGSFLSIIDCNGDKVFDADYDAWGKQRVHLNEIGFLRGYTGHEMWNEFGIINMNGRLYDPTIARFLSPDNYVQAPDNSQNFNRYSYCLNNPLKYTDPSGEFWEWIVGAVVGAYMGGVIANDGSYNITKWDYGSAQTWGFMFSGAVVGGLSGYAGAAVSSAGFAGSNTAGIMVGSTINSLGTYAYTLGETPISVSAGSVSYDFTDGKFGYLGKKENSKLSNWMYVLGAMENLHDINNAIDATNCKLYTQHHYAESEGGGVDCISHSGIESEAGEIFMSYGPNTSGFLQRLAENAYESGSNTLGNYLGKAGFAMDFRGSTTEYDIFKDVSWESAPLRLNKHLFAGLRKVAVQCPYQGMTSNCVNWCSIGLWLNGIPNIGIHPYMLNASVSLYNTGAYRISASYGGLIK